MVLRLVFRQMFCKWTEVLISVLDKGESRKYAGDWKDGRSRSLDCVLIDSKIDHG